MGGIAVDQQQAVVVVGVQRNMAPRNVHWADFVELDHDADLATALGVEQASEAYRIGGVLQLGIADEALRVVRGLLCRRRRAPW